MWSVGHRALRGGFIEVIRPWGLTTLHGDKTAVFDITNSEQIEGGLATPQRKLVEAWITLHRDGLLADWTLSESGELPFRIDPLR